ncbi:MAG: molybdate ABC transporter substrate-binding protein [Acidobacteria bacterium]|nr:molybdate ABC transporter substrate-binding protein [Acidobacteriota bacterium]
MFIKRFRSVLLVAAAIFILGVSAIAAQKDREILISTAISLKDAFEEISALYQKRTGIRARLNLGSSGMLQKQIEAGAPADVYASAGMKQMDALEAGGFIVPGTRYSFARNRIVLVVPSLSSLGLHSFSDLAGSGISRLAIGNPKTVPAGQYARQTLISMALWDRLQSRLIPAENVRQVLDYVVREEVDAGIVYASDVPVSHGKAVIAARAPEDSHDPILYPIAVVKGTESPAEAGKFIDLVLDDSGQAIMKKYGFLPLR